MQAADMRELAESQGLWWYIHTGALLSGYSHWNAGLKTPQNKSQVDDFGFTLAMIEKLLSSDNIDPDRIYACGYSNGGYFAYALACFHSDKIAAVGSVASTMMEETYGACNPEQALSVINIHGTSDSIIPYEGPGKDGKNEKGRRRPEVDSSRPRLLEEFQ